MQPTFWQKLKLAWQIFWISPGWALTIFRIRWEPPAETPDGWRAALPNTPEDVECTEWRRYYQRRLSWAVERGMVEWRRNERGDIWWRVRDPAWWEKAREAPAHELYAAWERYLASNSPSSQHRPPHETNKPPAK